MCDNNSTIQLSKHAIFLGKNNNIIDVRFHFLQINDEIFKLNFYSYQN